MNRRHALFNSSFILHTSSLLSGERLVRTRLSQLLIVCLCALALAGCQHAGSTTQGESSASSASSGKSKFYSQPVRLADLEDRAIKESSGIVASRRDPDIFWTHNDSGNSPTIYAF